MEDTAESAVEQALGVMEAHIKAINARDNSAIAATLHFPHYRLSANRLKVWETEASYLQDFLERAGSEWCYSRFDDIKVLHSSELKVHLDAAILRFRKDDSLITDFRSLWVITRVDGAWAAQFRSSFAQA